MKYLESRIKSPSLLHYLIATVILTFTFLITINIINSYKCDQNISPLLHLLNLPLLVFYLIFLFRNFKKIKEKRFIHYPLIFFTLYVLVTVTKVINVPACSFGPIFLELPLIFIIEVFLFIWGLCSNTSEEENKEGKNLERKTLEKKDLAHKLFTCPKCHTIYNSNDIYCNNCGKQLKRNPKYDNIKIEIVYFIICILILIIILSFLNILIYDVNI